MISEQAIVKTQTIGTGVRIDPFVVVEEGVVLGKDVVIHSHVMIGSGVEIGDGVQVSKGALVGKAPAQSAALSRKPSREGTVRVGPRSFLGPNVVIYLDVEIGEDCLIGDGASIREGCRIGSKSVIGRYVTLNYEVSVGERAKIMDHSWMAGRMQVQDDVFISGGVMTANDPHLGRKGFQEQEIRGPTIERDAAIGAGAVLLPGIVVGRGSIVGAGAVVTRNVKPGDVVMGIPARTRAQ